MFLLSSSKWPCTAGEEEAGVGVVADEVEVVAEEDMVGAEVEGADMVAEATEADTVEAVIKPLKPVPA
jgi:hypothetical protein